MIALWVALVPFTLLYLSVERSESVEPNHVIKGRFKRTPSSWVPRAQNKLNNKIVSIIDVATMVDLGIILVAIEVVVIIAVSVTAGEWVRSAAVRLAKRAGATPEVTGAIRDAVRAVWIVGTIAGVLIVTGVANSLQALTIGGLAGLTVSLALQSTLSNILASVLFFNDNTLRLNDTVYYGGVRGMVIRISLRTTWIRGDDGNITIVSNNTLMNGPFTNYTAKERLMKKLYL